MQFFADFYTAQRERLFVDGIFSKKFAKNYFYLVN